MARISPALRAFLAANPVGVLATQRRDGSPRQSLVYFAVDHERLLISTLASRHKARDVRRTGRASLCVMGHERPFPSASFEGSARIVETTIAEATAAVLLRVTGRPTEPPPPRSWPRPAGSSSSSTSSGSTASRTSPCKIIKRSMTAPVSSAAVQATTAEDRRIALLQERFPDCDVEVLAVALAIGRASVDVHRRLTERVQEQGLTPVALQALIGVFLAGDDPVDYKNLGHELRVTKANVSLVLADLERKGLIVRRPDPSDGRKVRGRLTSRGRTVLAELLPVAEECFEAALVRFDPAERQRLKALVERVA